MSGSIIYALGGPSAVAGFFGITVQAVSQWEKIPVERAVEIERRTGGRITARELRPDLYGVGVCRPDPMWAEIIGGGSE